MVGILAIKVALGGREESPDKEGALRTIGEQPFGKGLLLLLAAGLAGYALWRLAQAVLDRDDEGEEPKGLAKRAAALGKAGWYAILCGLTLSVLVGNGGGGGSEQQRTAGVFERPLGRYVVYAAGLAFLGAAAFNGYRAVTCKFNKKLKTGEMSEAEEGAATAVGILGHLARLAVFGLIGALPRQGRLGVRPQGGPRARRRAPRALAAAVRALPARRRRRRPARVRPLLLRAGPLPPHLERAGTPERRAAAVR